jgi:hypothetical protein
MKTKKILVEEINRILVLMSVDKKYEVISESRITKQQVESIASYFQKKFLGLQPNARTGTVDLTTTSRTYSFDPRNFDNFKQKIDDLKLTNDFDNFLTTLNSNEYNVISDMIKENDPLLTKIYNDFMTTYFNEINLSGSRTIFTEAQFLEELSAYLKNNKDTTLREVLELNGIPSFYSDIFSYKMNQKIEFLDSGDMKKFSESTKDIVTDVYIKNNTEGALNPINWTRNMENEANLSNDEIEELIKIVDPAWYKKLIPKYIKNKEDAEAIASLLSRLNRQTQNITPEQIKLNDTILEAVDQRLKYMYSTNREIYEDVSKYLTKNAEKIDPDSPLGKVLDKIKKYPSDATKAYSLSLGYQPARDAFSSMRNAFTAIDWTQIVKGPIRWVTSPMNMVKKWRETRDEWIKTWLSPEATRGTEEFKRLFRHGSSKPKEYFDKILQDGKKLSWFIERYGESFLRVLKFQVQMAFLETALEAILQGPYYTFIRGGKIEACRQDLLKSISEDKRHKDKKGKYVPQSSDELGYYAKVLAPEYDLLEILQQGVNLPPSCADMNILDKAVIDYMSQGETDYFLTELVENLKKNTIGALTTDFGRTAAATALPGYVDDIGLLVMDIIMANKEGEIQKIREDLVKLYEEIKSKFTNAKEEFENDPNVRRAQERLENLGQETHQENETGLKKYLENLTPPKQYEENSFQAKSGGFPAEGQDTEGNVYIFSNNKWIPGV